MGHWRRCGVPGYIPSQMPFETAARVKNHLVSYMGPEAKSSPHLTGPSMSILPRSPFLFLAQRLQPAGNNVQGVNNKGKRTEAVKKTHYFVHLYLLLRKICFACLIIFSRSPSLDCNELISFLSKAWGPESLILLWPKGALAGWGIMTELKVCLWNCNKNSHFLLIFIRKCNGHIIYKFQEDI